MEEYKRSVCGKLEVTNITKEKEEGKKRVDRKLQNNKLRTF